MTSKNQLSQSTERLRTALDELAEKSPESKREQKLSRAMYSFANEIRRVRRQKQITQTQLAESMGVPQSFVARLENPQSDKKPSFETMVKAADALDLDITIQFVPERSAVENTNPQVARVTYGTANKASLREAIEIVRKELGKAQRFEENLTDTGVYEEVADLIGEMAVEREKYVGDFLMHRFEMGLTPGFRHAYHPGDYGHNMSKIFCGFLDEEETLQIPTDVNFTQNEAAVYAILAGTRTAK